MTLSSPDCVISPTLNWPGPGQATSCSVSGIASGLNSGGVGGGATSGGGVSLVINNCYG